MNNAKIKFVLILLLSTLVAGCFDGNDKELPMPNQLPVVVSIDLVTESDTAIMDRLTATDPEMDSLTFSLETPPTLGSVDLNANGQFTYQPNATVTGNDNFVFSVSDGISGFVTATVNITIEAQQVNISSYTRAAFAQAENDVPLPTNGREFVQDVTDPDAFDDLLNNP